MKYTVAFVQHADVTITVDLPEDADSEEIVEAAWMEGPGGICAQCSGWGQNFSRDVGDLEPYEVDGKPQIYRDDE